MEKVYNHETAAETLHVREGRVSRKRRTRDLFGTRGFVTRAMLIGLLTGCPQTSNDDSTVDDDVTTVVDDDGTAGDDDSSVGDDDSSVGDDDSGVGDDDSGVGDDDSTAGDDDSTVGDDDTIGDDDSSVGDDDSSVGDDDSGVGDDDSSIGDDDSTAGDDDTTVGDDDTIIIGDDDSAGDDDSSGDDDSAVVIGDDDTIGDDDSAVAGDDDTTPPEIDSDGDGYFVSTGDCDDTNVTVFPGAPELCDQIDNDCDQALPAVEIDADGDLVIECDGDCDDLNADIFPLAVEVCDGLDNDCDLIADGEVDGDADGQMVCEGDCDDGNAAVLSGAVEVCDGLDNDCDLIADGEVDDDADGQMVCAGDCDDAVVTTYLGAVENCNGVDDNCDLVVVGEDDVDLDFQRVCDGDCDDGNVAVLFGAVEVCDGLDNDCVDGIPTDELDDDGDGGVECVGTDCDDGNASIYLAATEICDGIDNDCDSLSPGEVDGDVDGQMVCAGDCADGVATVFAGAPEICDGLDNNCDGVISGEADADLDLQRACAGDCDDLDASRYLGAPELCNAVDDNCDAVVPANETDGDGDTFVECTGSDCDDNDATVFLGATEVCDGIDDDCDLVIPANEVDSDSDGYAECEGDCEPTNALHNGTEDEDGDGVPDFCGDNEVNPLEFVCQAEFSTDTENPLVRLDGAVGDVTGDGIKDLVYVTPTSLMFVTGPFDSSSDCNVSFIPLTQNSVAYSSAPRLVNVVDQTALYGFDPMEIAVTMSGNQSATYFIISVNTQNQPSNTVLGIYDGTGALLNSVETNSIISGSSVVSVDTNSDNFDDRFVFSWATTNDNTNFSGGISAYDFNPNGVSMLPAWTYLAPSGVDDQEPVYDDVSGNVFFTTTRNMKAIDVDSGLLNWEFVVPSQYVGSMYRGPSVRQSEDPDGERRMLLRYGDLSEKLQILDADTGTSLGLITAPSNIYIESRVGYSLSADLSVADGKEWVIPLHSMLYAYNYDFSQVLFQQTFPGTYIKNPVVGNFNNGERSLFGVGLEDGTFDLFDIDAVNQNAPLSGVFYPDLQAEILRPYSTLSFPENGHAMIAFIRELDPLTPTDGHIISVYQSISSVDDTVELNQFKGHNGTGDLE